MKDFINILDKEVSIYNGVTDNKGTTTKLRVFLSSRKHKDEITRLRESNNEDEKKTIKLSLPQATISGVFSPTRKAGNLVKHSGLICIDIDAKDNQAVEMDSVKLSLMKYREIAYISQSVSGKGLFAIIPILEPDSHKAHFRSIKDDFLQKGIHIDDACSDITRLRCMSFDEAFYYNPNALIYTKKYTEPQRINYLTYYKESGDENIEKYIIELERTRTDITACYQDWFRVGASFASLGERGRNWFHRVSALNPYYNPLEADKKFNEWMRNTSQITLGTFIHVCKDYGIFITEPR